METWKGINSSSIEHQRLNIFDSWMGACELIMVERVERTASLKVSRGPLEVSGQLA